jgi:hypothetical protein
MGEFDKWLAGEMRWEDLSATTQKRIDEEAMGISIGNQPSSELLHKSDDEKRFTLGPWYIPNRLDAHNEWTDAQELQAGLWDYVRKGDRGIRLQHNRDIVAGEWVEAMQMPVEVTMRKHAEDSPITYPEGTVFLGVVWKPWAWDLVKKGKIRGFSIGGSSARIPIEPITKSRTEVLTLVPGLISYAGRSYAVKPVEEDLVISDGKNREVTSLERLVDAMNKSADTFGWTQDDRRAIHDLIQTQPLHQGFWFRGWGRWHFTKATFGSRSEAGRYAANQRWMQYGIAVRDAFSKGIDAKAQAVKFGANGLPEPGPLGLPKTAIGAALGSRYGSMLGHVDFDAVAAKMTANPDKFGVTDPLKLPSPPYELLRKHMTAERKALHDAILDSEMAGKAPVEGRDPVYTFLGGGGASGKSSILESGQVEVASRTNVGGKAVLSNKRDAIEINSDEIKGMLPEYRALTESGGAKQPVLDAKGRPVLRADGTPRMFDPGRSPNPQARYEAASFVHEESSMLGKALNQRAMKMGLDVVLDGTADGKPGTQAAKIAEIQAIHPMIGGKPANYQTRMIMVTVPTDVAVERAYGRAVETGRHVPETSLREAHTGASRAFQETKHLYDQVEGYDTTTRPATKFIEGGKGNLKVLDQKVYDDFVSKAAEPTDAKYPSIDSWMMVQAGE